MSITLYHLNASRSERIFWLLEELDVPYEVKTYLRTAQGGAPRQLAHDVPLGKAPSVMIDGKVYTESGPIIHRILATHKHAGIEAEQSYDSNFWSHFAEGTLMLHLQSAFTVSKISEGFAAYKSLYLLLFFLKGVSAFNDFYQKYQKGNIQPALDEVEAFLEKSENFSGTSELGEGDFMMLFPLNSIAHGGRQGMYTLGPRTLAWVDRMRARPAFKKGMERMKMEETQARETAKL